MEANTIISPFTGVGVANFNLGHFAEGQREQYVCLEVEENAAESCANEMQENQKYGMKKKTKRRKRKKIMTNEKTKTNGGANREDQTAKEGGCDGIYENQNQNDNQQSRSEAKCSFDHLPNEVIAMIFDTALRSCSNSNPSDACILFQRLRNVCS